jgi:hypothetical protein
MKTDLGKFKPNPLNPRRITDEQLANLKSAMQEFGDLSGLVVNLTTGQMIGGHQRVKILGNAPVEILHRFPKPTKRGTVAEGVVNYEGERFVYREVRWTPDREKAAMIAANKHGGDWSLPDLSALLADLNEAGVENSVLGFSEQELAAMLSPTEPHQPGDNILPEDMRTLQLVFKPDALAAFMEKARLLGVTFGTANIGETVMQAVAESYEAHYGNDKNAEALVADAK